jgi:hypothetical protein
LPLGPGQERTLTTVVTYRVLLREGEDATEHTVERTYKSLVRPTPKGGPYLSQEGDTFFAEEVEGETIYGCRYGHGSRSV